MPDDLDVTLENITRELDAAIVSVRSNSHIAIGTEGDCDYCYEFSTRLVRNACARCRDKYKLG